MKTKVRIIPAILAKNSKDLKERLKKAQKVSSYVHVDIMDRRFVHNKTINYISFRGIRNLPKIEFHLMVRDPKEKIIKYIPYCDAILFHFETTKDVFSVIREVKKHNKKVGIVINPKTNISVIFPYLTYLDKVLIMSVNPGRSGQKFISSALTKIRKLKKINKKIDICVDGGINNKNALKVIKAGANSLVLNSYLYNSSNLQKTYNKLKGEISNVK